MKKILVIIMAVLILSLPLALIGCNESEPVETKQTEYRFVKVLKTEELNEIYASKEYLDYNLLEIESVESVSFGYWGVTFMTTSPDVYEMYKDN